MNTSRHFFWPCWAWPLPTRARWSTLLLATLLGLLSACSAMGSDKSGGVGLTGIDHLEEHLSVSNFWVNGHWGAQAGKGGRLVCCVIVPNQWRPGLTAKVQWEVLNWRDRTGEEREAVVPIDRYEDIGRMYVHFLRDGTVRVTLANVSVFSDIYPGTREPVPRKEPWKKYPWPSGDGAKSMFEGAK
jgi:Protein of unknown function (DUF3304)